MEINPYQSPSEEASRKDLPAPDNFGPWRDDRLLVVRTDSDAVNLPEGCLLGEPGEPLEWFEQNVTLPGRKTPLHVRFQLGPAASRKWRLVNRLQWALIVADIALFLVIPWLAFMIPAIRDNWLPALMKATPHWLFLTLAIGIPLSLVVFHTILIRMHRYLELYKSEAGFAWLGGAAPEWLGRLREFGEP